MPVDTWMETPERQKEAKVFNREDVRSLSCKKSNVLQRCHKWIHQSNVRMQTEPIETDGRAHQGGAGKKGDKANQHPNHSKCAPWVPQSLILLSLSAIRSPFFLSQLAGVTQTSGHQQMGCRLPQTARHHTLTFNETDPDRWLASNTNSCINLPNKVKDEGSTLPLHEQPQQPKAAAPRLEAVLGSVGRLTRQPVHFTRASSELLHATPSLPLACVWD